MHRYAYGTARAATLSRHQTRIIARASVDDTELRPRPPPPPPPPLPPMPQGDATRRNVLVSLGASATTGLVGYLIGTRQQLGGIGSSVGLDLQERREIDDLRLQAKFRRDYEGHVWAQTRAGDWTEVRLDANIPGTMLLRDKDGYVSFITLNLQQIDLTDDYAVSAIFAGGDWESLAERVQGKDDDGTLIDVRLDQDSFRDVISLMS